MNELLFPKPEKKEKKKEGFTYYNSTIRIKPEALKKKKEPVRHEIKRNTVNKNKTLKKCQKPYKPMYPYASIFTKDLSVCYISGSKYNVEIHHIFGGSRKHLSEKYHFILPLTSEWHTMAPYAIHRDTKLNIKYKKLCQDYWINTLHKTREEWLAEFGKWWD